MIDEEMGEPLKGDFLNLEIDLDYEFDAARYFDFSRQESFAAAWEAQLWFETAGSYPPSRTNPNPLIYFFSPLYISFRVFATLTVLLAYFAC